jgi:hypothetical protein
MLRHARGNLQHEGPVVGRSVFLGKPVMSASGYLI